MRKIISIYFQIENPCITHLARSMARQCKLKADIVNCPFCPPKVNDNAILLENELSLFIDLKHSILQGSGIIVPRSHRQSMFDLTPEEITSTFSLLTEVKAFLDAAYEPQGYNLGWNSGTVAGQTVFHAHLHVIPRYASEPYAGKGIRHWLKQESNRRCI